MRLKSLLPVLLLGGVLVVIVFTAMWTQRKMYEHETGASSAPAAAGDQPAGPPPNPNTVPDELVERQRLADEFPDTLANIWGIRYKILREGEGPKPIAGNRATVNYVTRLLDGTEIDSSAKSGKPLTFQLKSGRMIRGLDEAVSDMRKGEKRLVIVPYKYAYGSQGRPPKIPPRAPLVFEVELLSFE